MQAAQRLEPSQERSVPARKQTSLRAISRLAPLLRNRKALAGSAIILVFVLIAILAPVLTHVSPNDDSSLPLQPPSAAHWFGTTSMGQDVFSQFVWGTRTSMILGIVAGALTTLLSVVIGLVSGYFGGWIDEFLQLVTNIFLIIPGLPLMIVLAEMIPFGGDVPLIVVITLTGWAWGARVFRSQILTMRTLPYVESAMMAGETGWSIIFREIFPNMLSLIFANFLYSILYSILSASGLQFLGLGDLKEIDWGTSLYWAYTEGAILDKAWWWFIPAGAGIAILGAGLALLNYAVDEMTNPKLQSLSKRRLRAKKRRVITA